MKVKEIIGAALFFTMLCSFASQTVVFAYAPKPHPKLKHAISFDQYHTYDEMVRMLKVMRRRYPRLMKLYSIGKSFLGKKIWSVEITSKFCGKAMSKPALIVIGEHHGDEIIAKEVGLYFMWHLLTNYGSDPKITRILNTRTIYVIPLVNPDGNDLTLLEGQIQRQNARPIDEALMAYLTKTHQKTLTEMGKQLRCDNGMKR